jgi:hypothetical protein
MDLHKHALRQVSWCMDTLNYTGKGRLDVNGNSGAVTMQNRCCLFVAVKLYADPSGRAV